jgi:hypothetical protein
VLIILHKDQHCFPLFGLTFVSFLICGRFSSNIALTTVNEVSKSDQGVSLLPTRMETQAEEEKTFYGHRLGAESQNKWNSLHGRISFVALILTFILK